MSIDEKAFAVAAEKVTQHRSTYGAHFCWDNFRVFIEAYEAASATKPVSLEECAIAACEDQNYTHDIKTPDCAALWKHNKETFLRIAKAVLDKAGVPYVD